MAGIPIPNPSYLDSCDYIGVFHGKKRWRSKDGKRLFEWDSFHEEIEITAYIEAANLDGSQEVQEDLLLRILDIVAQSGTDFAFPSQTLYMARDKGTDADKTTDTNDIVKQWREANELHLPSFTPEHIEKLKGSVKYPPEGSAVGRED